MPDADDPASAHPPTMLTTDLALRFDPVYEPISRRFHENPDEFADAFARAWFKLTHRDMGPVARYLGPEVPAGGADLAGPASRRVDHELIGAEDVAALKEQILASGLSVSAAGLDRVGVGLDVPRQRQARRRQRRAHPPRAAERTGRSTTPTQLATVLGDARGHPAGVQRRADRRQAGLARRPDRPRRLRRGRAGRQATPGTTSRCRSRRAAPTPPQEQTDVESFAALEPTADGFRNYLGKGQRLPAEYLLVDRANLLTLSAPEMTVLVGGLRVLGANYERLADWACSPTARAR